MVKAGDVSKSYGDKNVFKGVDFEINRGEKVAFVGKNGMGKTTMVKLINGLKPTMGEINLGHNVKLGYYAQIQENTLNAEETVFETLDNIPVCKLCLIRWICRCFFKDKIF